MLLTPSETEKSEKFFRCLVENASDIVAVLDPHGVIRYANPAITKVMGYSPEEFVGKNMLDFIHEEDRQNLGPFFSPHDQQKNWALEFRFRHKSGDWRGLEAVGQVLTDEEGPGRVLVNARDITDRVLEQEALRESVLRHLRTQTELQKTQQKIIQKERLAAIGQMASGIAHDFSNALMPVLGFSDILLNRPEYLQDLPRVRKYLGMINVSARDAMQIVAGLREFYRTKAKKDHLTSVNLNKLIEQTVLMTRPKWREESNARNIPIQVRLALNPVPDMVANEVELREALTNLIFNAVDALAHGGQITFSTRWLNEEIILEVTDNGEGMTEETRLRCLEPFYSSKEKGGTGLGLAMVYGVVTRHQGIMEVRSQVGQGSTFEIRLPLRNSLAPDTESLTKRSGRYPVKLAVLVVDDEPMVRDVLKEYLTGDGHEVETAENGVKAWEAFRQKKFDLIITDRAMPEMNGDELTDKIKGHSPKIPLIMLTGFAELMKCRNECPQSVDHLLAKPLTLEAYREALFTVLPA